MSFNRVIPHSDEDYVEAVIDGYEDWESAMHVIEKMTSMAEEMGTNRILLNFSTVDMRISVSEAPEIGELFHTLAPGLMFLGIIPSTEERAARTIEAFSRYMDSQGHSSRFLTKQADIDAWVKKEKLYALKP